MVSMSVLMPLIIINVLLAWSLWFPLVGGQLSMVVPLFAGVGGYCAALLQLHVTDSVPVSLASAAILAGLVGIPVGLLGSRLRSFGLAIATLGAVVIAQTVYQNLPSLGGAVGLYGMPVHEIVLPGAVTCLVAGSYFWVVFRSRLGRALFTLQYDEPLTGSLGIAPPAAKVHVLFVSGLLGGAAGALSVMYTGFVDPSQFGPALITQLFAFVICGGITSWWGPAIGATVLTVVLQNLSIAGSWRQIIFGLLLSVVVVLRPEGLTVRSARLSALRLRRTLSPVRRTEQPLPDAVPS
jgi:branched-chain amino acid transport system permease protein